MVAISQPWYNGSYTIAAKPIKTLESHYTMIQFLIIEYIHIENVVYIKYRYHNVQFMPTPCPILRGRGVPTKNAFLGGVMDII